MQLNLQSLSGEYVLQKKRNTINGVYAITHHDQTNLKQLLAEVEAALKGGVSILQFRDKASSANEKKQRAQALKTLCYTYCSLFIINDDVELCQAVQADGVHLGLKDSSIKKARELLGDKHIIGATCHDSPILAREAEVHGASYIALGSFFPSQSKPDAKLATIDCIDDIKQQTTLPIVAIGGITLDNAPALIKHGAESLAIIDDLFGQPDLKSIESQARKLSQLFS